MHFVSTTTAISLKLEKQSDKFPHFSSTIQKSDKTFFYPYADIRDTLSDGFRTRCNNYHRRLNSQN